MNSQSEYTNNMHQSKGMTSFAGASNVNGDYDSSEDEDIENSSKWGASSMAPVNSLAAMGLKAKSLNEIEKDHQVKAKIKK